MTIINNVGTWIWNKEHLSLFHKKMCNKLYLKHQMSIKTKATKVLNPLLWHLQIYPDISTTLLAILFPSIPSDNKSLFDFLENLYLQSSEVFTTHNLCNSIFTKHHVVYWWFTFQNQEKCISVEIFKDEEFTFFNLCKL